MSANSPSPWLEPRARDRVAEIENELDALDDDGIESLVHAAIVDNRRIHEHDCVNLNPATNVMNPRAEAVLSEGLGSRPSLGHPGEKYEMGLEAIERIEVAAARLARQVFDARFAEIRVGSGALANLYAFLATCRPGDAVIVPPAAIAGHVTHHDDGCAGLMGLDIHEAPIDPEHYTVDLDGLASMARRVRPALITIGGSLNLEPHPVRAIREIADDVGAKVLFDAAHQCGLIAGRVWPNPLADGAHLMTMSTYKSLGGPAGGLLVTDDAHLAERVDAIAFPGLTANFDVAKSAALAISLLDWVAHGEDYARAMVDTATGLASELGHLGLPVFQTAGGWSTSHQFALDARPWNGGQRAAQRLREANILACGIGLPIGEVDGDVNGLRLGTPEIVRWGMGPEDMAELAGLVDRGLRTGEDAAADTTEFRQRFTELHHIRD